MISDQLTQLIQGIGTLTEIWTITYQGFIRQGLSAMDAMRHTKEFMAIMLDQFIDIGKTEEKK